MIDYALAPSGATHHDFFKGNYFYLKKTLNGKSWLFFCNEMKEWMPCYPKEEPTEQKLIPEREQELNRLADLCQQWHTDHARRAYVHSDGDVVFPTHATESDTFSYVAWITRRTARIEAGLIKESSDLADINAANWDGKGIPPVGVECEMAREGEMFQAGRILFRGDKLFVFRWSDNNQEVALRYHQVKFRPIKTDDQIATEKRDAWIKSALVELKHWPKSFIPDPNVVGHVYDALLSGELEAPKVDL